MYPCPRLALPRSPHTQSCLRCRTSSTPPSAAASMPGKSPPSHSSQIFPLKEKGKDRAWLRKLDVEFLNLARLEACELDVSKDWTWSPQIRKRSGTGSGSALFWCGRRIKDWRRRLTKKRIKETTKAFGRKGLWPGPTSEDLACREA